MIIVSLSFFITFLPVDQLILQNTMKTVIMNEIINQSQLSLTDDLVIVNVNSVLSYK